MIIHLDPAKLAELGAAVDAEGLRVLVALLGLAPNGDLSAPDRRLATAAGFADVEALRTALERLAVTRLGKHPIIIREKISGGFRTRITAPAGLAISHPTNARERGGPAEPRRSAARRPIEDIVAELAKTIEEVGDEALLTMTDALVAHLATAEEDGKLPSGRIVQIYGLVLSLVSQYGIGAVNTAIRAGLGKKPEDLRSIERLIEVVAAREWARDPSVTSASGKERRSLPIDDDLPF